VEKKTFRLFRNDEEVRLEVISDVRWKVVSASEKTGFLVGDELSPANMLSWQKAKRRVNSGRSALSAHRLLLLRGEGTERSEEEVVEMLRTRPWDPDFPPAA
jgi:hypothetical protein